MHRNALIAGGGIGGLAAALALRRAGWQVRVFERAHSIRELGFGLGLAPNAIAALRALGIRDEIAANGFTPMSGELRLANGRVLRHIEVLPDRLPANADQFMMVLRPVVHNALLHAVGREVVEVGREAVGFEASSAGVTLRLADGTTAAGDILIGADGVGSIVRAGLHRTEPPPRPSGYYAIRGASPAIAALNGLGALFYFDRGVESGIVRASRTTIYWYLSLFAEDVNATTADAPTVLRAFTKNFDGQYHAITGATSPADIRGDELFERNPLDRWGTGRVTLLGDAAHPMLPHTGQGAAQALEDAVALGHALAPEGDVVDALRRYESARAPRSRRVVTMGPRIAAVTTTKNPLVALLRNTAIRIVPEGVLVKAFTQARVDSGESTYK